MFWGFGHPLPSTREITKNIEAASFLDLGKSPRTSSQHFTLCPSNVLKYLRQAPHWGGVGWSLPHSPGYIRLRWKFLLLSIQIPHGHRTTSQLPPVLHRRGFQERPVSPAVNTGRSREPAAQTHPLSAPEAAPTHPGHTDFGS